MRIWNNKKQDDFSVHCMGNGEMAAYSRGPEVFQIFGPPYSGVSFIELKMNDTEEEMEVKSSRVRESAIWEHDIYLNGKKAGAFTDFVASCLPCFVRKAEITEDIDILISLNSQLAEGLITRTDNTSNYLNTEVVVKSFLFLSEPGIYAYARYPIPFEMAQQLILAGDLQIMDSGSDNITVKLKKGISYIYVFGACSYPELGDSVEEGLSQGYTYMHSETRKFWDEFSGRRIDFSKKIPDNFSEKDRLLEIIDDVSILIKCQQSIEGGVLAGYNYHLGYVRDQYGVSRCLLKLGYYEEAKRILLFYWNIWKKYGRIHNAQAMGIDGIFHIHENDEVEITGYLVIQAFDYLEETRDEKFLVEISPMLKWAFESQEKHLAEGMLPFNGDETYVAGAVFPRSALNDGSAEATLLFITGSKKLINWAKKYSIWESDFINEKSRIIEDTEKSYHEKFWTEKGLMTNNPLRTNKTSIPEYRHGVCEQCGRFGWTKTNTNNRYVCPLCLPGESLEESNARAYYLQSVSLIPPYIKSDTIKKEETEKIVSQIIDNYNKTGKFPSRPDGDMTVGYDFGLFLYTLTYLKNPLAKEIFNKTIEVIDPAGAWVEYYIDKVPAATRCRPWESGINLEALIEYATEMN